MRDGQTHTVEEDFEDVRRWMLRVEMTETGKWLQLTASWGAPIFIRKSDVSAFEPTYPLTEEPFPVETLGTTTP